MEYTRLPIINNKSVNCIIYIKSKMSLTLKEICSAFSGITLVIITKIMNKNK